MVIKNRHGDTSLYTAVSLKKGNFNTPSEFQSFEKKNGGFDCYFKTAVRYYALNFTNNGFAVVVLIVRNRIA